MKDILNKESVLELYKMCTTAKQIALVAHIKPDGDAVGSTVAFASFLESRSLNARIILPHPVTNTLEFIAREDIIVDSERHEQAISYINGSDLIICLDLNTLSRAGELCDTIKARQCPKVLIDHHVPLEIDDFSLCIREVNTSSTCELLYYILLEMPGIDGDARRLPHECNYALMCGMTTDSNNFSNSVYPSTLKMASELIASGVDRDEILSKLLQNYRENRVRIMGKLLQEMSIVDGIAIMILNKANIERYDIQEGETEGIVNVPLCIADVHISIFAREDDTFFRLSVRSKQGYSARELTTSFFHGGGHEQASGGRVFIPDDIANAGEIKSYLERVAAQFMKKNQL